MVYLKVILIEKQHQFIDKKDILCHINSSGTVFEFHNYKLFRLFLYIYIIYIVSLVYLMMMFSSKFRAKCILLQWEKISYNNNDLSLTAVKNAKTAFYKQKGKQKKVFRKEARRNKRLEKKKLTLKKNERRIQNIIEENLKMYVKLYMNSYL